MFVHIGQLHLIVMRVGGEAKLHSFGDRLSNFLIYTQEFRHIVPGILAVDIRVYQSHKLEYPFGALLVPHLY